MADRISIAVFIGLFLFEPFYYVLSSSSLPFPPLPFGTLFGIMSTALAYRYLRQRNFLIPLAAIALSAISVAVTGPMSEWYDYQWIALFGWYASKFILGFAIADALSNRGWDSPVLAWSAIVFSAGIWGLLMAIDAPSLNYLRPSSTLLYAGVLAFVCARGLPLKAMVYISVAGALIVLTSRTYVYLWLTMPILVWCVHKVMAATPPKRAAMLLVAGCSLAVGVIGVFIILSRLPTGAIPERLTPSIALGTSGASVADHSINMRMSLLAKGWEQIFEHPLTGYYNGFMAYGGPGYYIHGVLSYWQQFGLIPFAVLLTGIAYVAVKLFSMKDPTQARPACVALILALLTSVLSRSYTDTNLLWAVGFCFASITVRQDISDGVVHIDGVAST